MKRLKLQRLWQDRNQATGILYVLNENDQPIFACLTVERGDRNNQRNVSNVPEGIYPLVKEWSPRFGMDLWELKDVPGRSECKIHTSNYWHQLNGCIAPGLRLKDLDKDGYYDVTNSKNTLKSLHSILRNYTRTTIEILNPR